MQIVDSHLHIWSQDEDRFPPSPDAAGPTWDASIETLTRYMDRHGVELAVAINPRLYLQDHRYLLDAAGRFPDRVIPVGKVHADDPAAVGLLHELADEHGIRGIRLVWYDGPTSTWPADPAVEPVWRACADLGITIGFLTNPDELPAIGEAASKHRQVTVVIDHWGGLRAEEGPEFSRFAAVTALASLPNVYLKATCFQRMSLAGSPYLDVHPLLRRALDAFGRERVMWGTDFGSGRVREQQYDEELTAITGHLDWLAPSDREWLLRRSALQAWQKTEG